MILCYEGTPGSGKSYDAIVKIIDNLKLGRTVYTNINGIDDPVCREHIKLKAHLDDYEISKRLVYLTDLEITQPHKHCKPGSLLIIDEVHKRLNARDWQTQKNKEFADWGSTHRHHGMDVLLITQGLEKVDSQVRGLVEFTHRYKKNNYFGSLFEKQFLVKVYEEDSTKIIGKRTGVYDKGIFKCYKSYVAGDIKEQKIQANVNILKHPIFYSIPILIAVFIYYFSKSSFISGDWFGTQAQYKKKVADIEKPKQSDAPLTPVMFHQEYDSKGNRVGETKVIMYERNLDSTGKPIGELKRTVLKGNRPLNEVKKASSSLVNSKGKYTGDKTLFNAPVSLAGLSPVIPLVYNYQGFVSSGDTLYVLIGNRKTSLSDLKVKYPDAEIIDGSLRLSGVIYNPGQSVPL